MRWSREIKSKSDVEAEQQKAWDEGDKTEIPTMVKPPTLKVTAVYWDGYEMVFTAVEDVGAVGGVAAHAVAKLTGPGPDVLIPLTGNVRYLAIEDA